MKVAIAPSTYKKAMKSPDYVKWKEAMHVEYDALMKNKTWTLVPTPQNTSIITCKWVFTIKYLSDGSIERFKARVVARGFLQLLGIDYNETFSPVLRMEVLRLSS